MTERLQIYVADATADAWRSKANAEGIPLGHWVSHRVREAESLAPGLAKVSEQLASVQNLLKELNHV